MSKLIINERTIEERKTSIQDLSLSCSQVVRYYRNLPGFQLLGEKEFIDLLVERCEREKHEETSINPRNIALTLYADSLFQAVNAKEDFARQEIGFQELSKYLYRIAYNFFLNQTTSINDTIEKAQECTQSAIERIFRNLHLVKTPGGFLKWCGIILRNLCLEEIRKGKREIPTDYDDKDIYAINDESQISFELSKDQEPIKAAIQKLKPRFAEIINLTFFALAANGEKLSDEQIASNLKISIENLYTLRSRALAALRKDDELLKFVQENL